MIVIGLWLVVQIGGSVKLQFWPTLEKLSYAIVMRRSYDSEITKFSIFFTAHNNKRTIRKK